MCSLQAIGGFPVGTMIHGHTTYVSAGGRTTGTTGRRCTPRITGIEEKHEQHGMYLLELLLYKYTA